MEELKHSSRCCSTNLYLNLCNLIDKNIEFFFIFYLHKLNDSDEIKTVYSVLDSTHRLNNLITLNFPLRQNRSSFWTFLANRRSSSEWTYLVRLSEFVFSFFFLLRNRVSYEIVNVPLVFSLLLNVVKFRFVEITCWIQFYYFSFVLGRE